MYCVFAIKYVINGDIFKKKNKKQNYLSSLGEGGGELGGWMFGLKCRGGGKRKMMQLK